MTEKHLWILVVSMLVSAFFASPTPSFAAITVLIPTPVPTARAIIKSWIG